MGRTRVVEREWTLDVLPDEAPVRCRYRRRGGEILAYTVQLEIRHDQTWQPIVRYDNAHGFCHRDTIHPAGTQDKLPIYRGDTNFTFTWAIEELRTHWEPERSRFLAEMKPRWMRNNFRIDNSSWPRSLPSTWRTIWRSMV